MSKRVVVQSLRFVLHWRHHEHLGCSAESLSLLGVTIPEKSLDSEPTNAGRHPQGKASCLAFGQLKPFKIGPVRAPGNTPQSISVRGGGSPFGGTTGQGRALRVLVTDRLQSVVVESVGECALVGACRMFELCSCKPLAEEL